MAKQTFERAFFVRSGAKGGQRTTERMSKEQLSERGKKAIAARLAKRAALSDGSEIK